MRFIKPMLAQKMKAKNTIEDYMLASWGMQLKIDGHRRMFRVQSGVVVAWSRLLNQVEWPLHILRILRELPDGVYDAEAYIPDGQATDVKRLDRQQDLRCAIFDVLEENSQDITEAPYIDRHRLICELLEDDGEYEGAVHVPKLAMVERGGIEEIMADGLEGVVIKDLLSSYQPGKRAKTWVKVKRSNWADVKVLSFEEGKLGPHSVLKCEDKDGQKVDVKARNDLWRECFAFYADEFIGETLLIRYETRATEGGYRHPCAVSFVDTQVPLELTESPRYSKLFE